MVTHQLSGLCPCDGEFQICVFLPISEQEGEFGKKSVVAVSCNDNGLRTGIAIETSFQAFHRANEFLPSLKAIGILELLLVSFQFRRCLSPGTNHFGIELL